ncbi:MAG TPA: acyl-CoA dehydrogenase family protein [Myxococcota bacterium]|jgi:alkylation response protein AidB-like acyl-CoA dehydrogenase
MDFRVDEDQQALRDGIRSFCEGRVPLDALGELASKELDRTLWRDLAEMGVFQLRLPEAGGGLGLGMAEAVLVFAELGRRLLPGPLVWSQLAAGLVEGAASGEAVVGGLDRMLPGSEPILVEHLDQLDALLVLRPGGVHRLDPRSLRAEKVATPLDPLTPIFEAAGLPEGERIAGPEAAQQLRLEGGALIAAQLFGIAEATQELATAYAKGREQFGRPIGSFQALKHLLADMFVRQELARSAAYAAGATLDHPEAGDPARAVSSAKVVAGDAALANSRACIQVHGGMGYTWEMPCHYYLKRTWALAGLFGSGEEHSERLAQQVAAAL